MSTIHKEYNGITVWLNHQRKINALLVSRQSLWLTKYFHLSVSIFCFVFTNCSVNNFWHKFHRHHNHHHHRQHLLSVSTMWMRWIRFCSPFVWYDFWFSNGEGRSLSQLATSLLCIGHEYLGKNWCAFVIIFWLLLDSAFVVADVYFNFSVSMWRRWQGVHEHTCFVGCWWYFMCVHCVAVTFNSSSIG